jgi:hypothetical protein
MVDDYRVQLAEDSTLWSVGEVTTAQLIRLACDALVSGMDSQALRELAGAPESSSSSDYDIEDILERVADDFGFTFYRRNSADGRLAGARVLAAQCVAGHLPPRELARWMHSRIKHGHEDQRVEALVSLDDQYDISDYTGQSPEQIDRAVLGAAERLLACR